MGDHPITFDNFVKCVLTFAYQSHQHSYLRVLTKDGHHVVLDLRADSEDGGSNLGSLKFDIGDSSPSTEIVMKNFHGMKQLFFCTMSNLIQKHPQAQLNASFSALSCSCFGCRTPPLSHCNEAFCACRPKGLERRGHGVERPVSFCTFEQRC